MSAQQNTARQNNSKKHRKKMRTSDKIVVVLIFLAIYFAIILFLGGSLLYSFHSTPDNDEIYGISVVYDELKIYEMEAEEANNEYGLYIPFEYLAEISSFGLAGEGDEVTLFLIGSDNRIKCTKNSSLVIINDNPIRISAPILYDEEAEDYLIPVALIENYINGVDVSYNDDKMVCTISSDLSKNDVALKLLLPEDMDSAYFPESYKYYDFGDESGDVSDGSGESSDTDE